MRPLAFSLMLALAACQSWPEDGRGGYAERRPIADPRLAELAQRFAHQREKGADRFAAGAVHEAQLLFIRAQRNHVAGFEDDVSRDLEGLRALLATIDRHLRKA